MRRLLGYFFIFISGLLFLYVIFSTSKLGKNTRNFSTYSLITSSWEKYKAQFINNDGRVIDYADNNITTSEGQSYAMLRSVWVDDRETFDKVWNFTKNSMKRPSDNLFGWRWGKDAKGNYGFANDADMNSATDADSDIALALILAGRRWDEDRYTKQALPILEDMWSMETASILGKRYITAGNWAKNSTNIIINPSYFAPYAYRIFAAVDSNHPWNDLLAPGYELLKTSGNDKLDTNKAVGLPPDWVAMDRKTGKLMKAEQSNLSTNYSYDAVRTPWRIALDYQWNKEQLAYKYLTSAYKTLVDNYSKNNKLAAAYKHDGTVLENHEGPTMYATAIGFLLYADPASADRLYQEKILYLYSNNTNSFASDLPYYDQNWLWFGAALYNKYLTPFD